MTRWLGGGAGLNLVMGVPPVWRALQRTDERLPGLVAGLEQLGGRYGLRPRPRGGRRHGGAGPDRGTVPAPPA